MSSLVRPLTTCQIERYAVEFRRLYAPDVRGRLAVESIIEFGLKLEVIPKTDLIRYTGMRGWLTADGRGIYVDADLLRRASFEYDEVLLHEGSHLVLHRSLLPKVPLRSRGDFIRFHDSFDAESIRVLEEQANELALRIRMPTLEVRHLFAAAYERVRGRCAGQVLDAERLVTHEVAEHFGVTATWARARLGGLWRVEQRSKPAQFRALGRMAPLGAVHAALQVGLQSRTAA